MTKELIVKVKELIEYPQETEWIEFKHNKSLKIKLLENIFQLYPIVQIFVINLLLILFGVSRTEHTISLGHHFMSNQKKKEIKNLNFG